MKRVLQLVAREADEESACGAALLRRETGDCFEITTRVIGRGGEWRDLAHAALSLRRSCRQFDLIHAWGGAALSAACLGSRLPIIFSPEAQPAEATMRRLRAGQRRRRIEVIAASESQRRWLIEHGALAGRCRLIRPAVDCGLAPSLEPARALRARLGLRNEDYVLLAPGESTRQSAHELAAWATSILNVADPRYKLLVQGRGPRAPAVRRFTEKTATGVLCDATLILAAPVDFQTLLGAADAALLTAIGPISSLPVAQCMSAGLPIVAAHSPIADELLMDNQSGMMSSRAPRLLARRVLDLVEGPAHRQSLIESARKHAAGLFDASQFVREHRGIYDSRMNVAGPSLTS